MRVLVQCKVHSRGCVTTAARHIDHLSTISPECLSDCRGCNTIVLNGDIAEGCLAAPFLCCFFLANTCTTRKECAAGKLGQHVQGCHSEPLDQDRCNFVSTIWRPSRTWHQLPQMAHTMFLAAWLLSFRKLATRIRTGTWVGCCSLVVVEVDPQTIGCVHNLIACGLHMVN